LLELFTNIKVQLGLYLYYFKLVAWGAVGDVAVS